MNKSFYFRKISALSAAFLIFTASFAFAQQKNLPAPREEKLLNGLKVLMWNDAKAENVSVKVRVHSGSAFDPQGKEGVMQMLADNIFPSDAAKEFFTDDLGGSLEIITNYDYIQINATAKPEEFLTMLETLAAAVSNPQIDKETTAKLRAARLEKIKELEKDPVYVADRAVAARLFGTFPYGRAQMGTGESVQKIDFADLMFARERFFTADNATIAVSGNFKPDLAFRAIRRYFGAWAKSEGKVPPSFRQPEAPQAGLPVLDAPVQNKSEVRYALRGLARNDKDFYASEILEKILQNRVQTREGKKAFVRHEEHILPGFFVFGVSDWNLGSIKKDGKTIALPVDADKYQIQFLKDAVKPEEFERAKAEFSAELNKTDFIDLWLDADTFRLSPVKTEWQNAQSVTIKDVQRVLDKLQKEPSAAVLIFSEEAPQTANQ
jgi:predicted Zn-dependent peptidase